MALALIGSYTHLFESYELQTFDWRCQIRGARPMSKDVVFIDIWDDSLKELGAWPFSRLYHAELIRILSEYGAKAVGFDVLFIEPREGDEEVVAAAKKAGNVYFVCGFSDVTPHQDEFFSIANLTPMLPEYAAAAKGIGHVNPKLDIDGKVRRVYPSIHFQGKEYHHLGLEMAMDVLGTDKLDLPLDDDHSFIINYAGVWEKSFKHYSYLDVLVSEQQIRSGSRPRIDLKQFKNKVCFVGLTSLGSHDTKPIPIQSVYPMVGMHANVLNSVLEKDFIRRLGRGWNALILLLLGAWIIMISSRTKPLAALGAVLVTMGWYIGLAAAFFRIGGLWVDIFCPLVVSVSLYSVTTLSRMMLEMRKREMIEKELKIASQIQKSFLPETLPVHPSLSLAVYMKPAKAVGGDLYAFIPLSDGKLGVMVGDVSGKGTPAALFMAKAVSEFKFSARDKNDPAAALSGMNDSVSSEATGGLFVTVSYVIFDVKNRRFLLSDAGHLPLARVGSSGAAELLSGSGGMPIGVMPGVAFEAVQRELKEGDCLAFYSDGVSEARDKKAHEFGVEALQKAIAQNRSRSCQEIMDAVVLSLNKFMGKADQHDDITLVLVKVGVL